MVVLSDRVTCRALETPASRRYSCRGRSMPRRGAFGHAIELNGRTWRPPRIATLARARGIASAEAPSRRRHRHRRPEPDRAVDCKRRQRLPDQTGRLARAGCRDRARRRTALRVSGARGGSRSGPASARGPQARRAREGAVDDGAQPLRAGRVPPATADSARAQPAPRRRREPDRRAAESARAEARTTACSLVH